MPIALYHYNGLHFIWICKAEKMSKWILVSMVAAISGSAFAVTINFDEFGAQPGLFNDANPLRNEYGGIGVFFSGPNALDGGAILDQSGNFGVNALSGRNFLAFNRANEAGVQMLNGGHPNDPQVITLSTAVSTTSIWASGGDQLGVFVMTAFDSSNQLIGGNGIVTNAAQWGLLSFTSTSANISKIVLTEASNAAYFVYDDFSAVPEPATLAVLGLGAVALMRRRRAR
jgi:PEP-CTERM motif